MVYIYVYVVELHLHHNMNKMTISVSKIINCCRNHLHHTCHWRCWLVLDGSVAVQEPEVEGNVTLQDRNDRNFYAHAQCEHMFLVQWLDCFIFD